MTTSPTPRPSDALRRARTLADGFVHGFEQSAERSMMHDRSAWSIAAGTTLVFDLEDDESNVIGQARYVLSEVEHMDDQTIFTWTTRVVAQP